ncbi:MAG: type I-D CRISPR-associated helicase Cas3', partial [Candidatus Poribacteria bacterium]|nr:type I-D CRISPR-associated helicase Cas3' [Candidatus Poribacteria bacterium]
MPEITVTLNAGSEKISPTNPLGLRLPPLYHQQRTYEALKTDDLVINTYNTGTGKTCASLLKLFDLEDENVLFIAPTNELIHQHADDIQEFVDEHGLNFVVAPVTGTKLREWEIVDNPGYRVRNPRKLYELIQNPRDYFPKLTRRAPLILVTNPDLFYLCFYSLYSQLDSANLFRPFLVKFNYIVIDEFHYYNAKQLANFLMFFILSMEYGYFNAGRKICLLSATPDGRLLTYLKKIGLNYALISPENEPTESKDYEEIQTLSALELTIHSSKMYDALKTQPECIRNLLDTGKEGAIISGSLRTINEIKQGLQQGGIQNRLGLITGAVSTEERRDATKAFPLVLATPTVDIGYNFKKAGKSRQNIDFVCFDALYGSEFIQRIGRAGRLLGKKDFKHPSIAHAYVQGKLYSRLQSGKNYGRREFASLVKDSLGEDNRFYYYIESYAVLEAFYPLYDLLRRTSEERHERVREIFEMIRQVFAPESETTFDEVMKKIRWHHTYKTVIDASEENAYNTFIQHQQEKATWSYFKHQSWLSGKLEAFRNTPSDQLNTAIRGFLKHRSNRERVVEHAKQKYHSIQSLFNFRGSDVGIRCGIHDPNHLFQNTAEHAEYDLFHVLSHCEFQQIAKRKYYELTGNWGNHCEFFVKVHHFKNPPQKIEFDYDAGRDNQESFERQYCWGPTALKGLRLRLINGVVPLEIQTVLTNRHITCLLSKMESRYALKNILETKRQAAQPLTVTFEDGKQQEYLLVFGSQAFLIHAELRGKWKEKE